jgi:hypothetical protein
LATLRLCARFLVLAAAGCASFGPIRNAGTNPPNPGLIETAADARSLVNWLNGNAAAINAIEADSVAIEIKGGGPGQQVGVNGVLHCQKPRNFRLVAKAVGKQVADVGSNSDEFWFWNSEDRPAYLYHCSYDAFKQRGVALPFPLQPEWVLETLGMATYDPSGTYTVRPLSDPKDPKSPPRLLELIQNTTGPGGLPIQKVTVFNNFNASGKTPQVVAYRVFDMQRRQLICQARVMSVHREKIGEQLVTVPYEMELNFPGPQSSQSLTMQLKLGDARVNGGEADAARNPRLYLRPRFQGVPEYDLARGLPPTASPAGIQRTGAFGR